MRFHHFVLIAALFAAASACSSIADPPAAPEGYELAWADEFDGDKLDTDRWYYRADNKHRSVQLPENVSVKDGSLVLSLNRHDQPIAGKRNSGAGIVTRERFRYGYYEVRAKLGDGVDHDNDGKVDEGWHHAFWAMAAVGNDKGHVSTTYPDIRRTEIDCYENADPDYNQFTQHIIIWKPDGKEFGRRPKPPADHTKIEGFDASQWHTYAFKWDEQAVTFYVDGEVTQVGEYPADQFTHDMVNVWLTAIAAKWCDKQPEQSVAYYDYFRFYKPVE